VCPLFETSIVTSWLLCEERKKIKLIFRWICLDSSVWETEERTNCCLAGHRAKCAPHCVLDRVAHAKSQPEFVYFLTSAANQTSPHPVIYHRFQCRALADAPLAFQSSRYVFSFESFDILACKSQLSILQTESNNNGSPFRALGQPDQGKQNSRLEPRDNQASDTLCLSFCWSALTNMTRRLGTSTGYRKSYSLFRHRTRREVCTRRKAGTRRRAGTQREAGTQSEAVT
jgi:hypothetical protein